MKVRDFDILAWVWGQRHRWEENIKMDLQEVGGGCGDWMEFWVWGQMCRWEDNIKMGLQEV
jgi:hypothetical protein